MIWRRALAGVAMLGLLTGAADWPSPAQIALVHERRASFPEANMVGAVDWYAPLETVRGSAQPSSLPERPVAQNSIPAKAMHDAAEYAAAQHSYAFLVWRNGALEQERYWAGFGPQSRFETASLHKTVVALALGAAVADGAVHSVDDKLSRYLPDLAGSQRGTITLRQLLEMRSGIETPTPGGADSSIYWQYYFGNDLKQDVAHWPMTCRQGSEFCYVNANAQYLGWVVQAATRRRYADYLSEKLWRPIGAGDARLWLDKPGGDPRFSCCLQAKARDWLRVGLLILDHGMANGRHVVPAAWIDRMTAPSAANPNYGWQLWRGSPYASLRSYGGHLKTRVPASQPFARDDVVYLEGSDGQRIYVIGSEKMVIVRIGAPSSDWDDSKLPNLILAGLKP